jgi:hypothetical protein
LLSTAGVAVIRAFGGSGTGEPPGPVGVPADWELHAVSVMTATTSAPTSLDLTGEPPHRSGRVRV